VTIIVDIGLYQGQIIARGHQLGESTNRVQGKCWERLLGNIATQLSTIDNFGATRRVVLNIRVADEWVVFPACKVMHHIY
jgi:hypothetical protein